jgi:uncharacterized NAD(P)/FAD-binding protein YdhS
VEPGQGAHAGPWDFLPRRLYRDYILALVREALQAQAGGTTFEHVRGEVTDIDTEGGCATIHVEDKGPIVVDKAVLALGNFPPRHPPIENRSALESERYIRTPWDPGVLNCLSRRDTVFLIGTGQTTVDLAMALHRRAHACSAPTVVGSLETTSAFAPESRLIDCPLPYPRPDVRQSEPGTGGRPRG